MGYCLLIVKQNIEINHPRPFLNGLFPAQTILYGLQGIQQINRAESGLNLDTTSEIIQTKLHTCGTHLANPIDKWVLIKNIHRCGFEKRACSSNPNASAVHLQTCFLNHSHTVSHVAPQRNEGSVERPSRGFIHLLAILYGIVFLAASGDYPHILVLRQKLPLQEAGSATSGTEIPPMPQSDICPKSLSFYSSMRKRLQWNRHKSHVYGMMHIVRVEEESIARIVGHTNWTSIARYSIEHC